MQMSHIQCRICIPQVAISRLFTQYYVLFALSGPLLSPTNYQSKPVSQVVNSSSSKLSFFNHIVQVLALAALRSRCQRQWKETPPLSRSASIYRYVGLIYVDKRSSLMNFIRDGAAPPRNCLHCLFALIHDGICAYIHHYN